MENKDTKKGNLENPMEEDVKSIDPTTLGGLDGSSAPKIDDEALEWTKSRGKKKS
ncbi:MAG: hypothetical protein JXR07_17810 [Reichenbachiella sp.]